MIPANALINTIQLGKPKRSGAPKSRSGCISCKGMHLRCDEAKPACSRCERSHRLCRYGEAAQKVIQPLTQPKVLLPKQGFTSHESFPLLLAQPRSSSLEPHEVPYFDLFRYQMAHDFGYTPCNLFWNKVIPREAMNDDCVKFSVLSVGALMQSLYRLGPRPYTGLKPFSDLSRASSDPTYRIALHYHSKAISALQARIKSNFATVSRRNTLINMFILFLFELMHGNTATADRMLTSSVELLRQKRDQLAEEVKEGFEPQQEPVYTAISNDEGLDQAERILPRLQVFFSLNSCFFPLQRDCWSRFSTQAIPCTVPSAKTDVNQFAALWNSFITRAVIFVVKILQDRSYCDAFHRASLMARRDMFLKQLRQWEIVIIERLDVEKDTVAKNTTKTFHVGQKVVYILLNCCLDPMETEYDKYDNVFAEIMEMMHSVEGTSGPSTRIETVLDIYVLPVLNFVSQKCRNKAIRLDSLNLFEKMTSTMGGWETRASLLARRHLMAIEEDGRDENGVIPAGCRYIWTDISWDKDQSYLDVYFHEAGYRTLCNKVIEDKVHLEEREEFVSR
ncbi:hypothetical protein BFJ68_g2016 [Fusarium oxysporum]|uniref:Zn(2)-C6 fungal-type domain-containing protein n=1 Tax=Fusarium oxysporum TaxID=5507 RepID=A0A420RXE2_FUSOX|nr:hypothetical protein BFJ68_g2016 [Fusarium oxysporum]